jgi:hypothetical protein
VEILIMSNFRNRNKSKGSLVPTGEGSSGSLSKTLRRAAVARPDGKGLEAVRKVTSKMPVIAGEGNITIIIDATVSRASVFEPAKEAIQNMAREVSQFGQMNLRVIDYGSYGDVKDRGWMKDIEKVCKEITSVNVRGGETQILDCLKMIVDKPKGIQTDSVIFIGDHYEEYTTQLKLGEIVALMKENNINVYTFQDSNDEDAAAKYKELAEGTGGSFAKLGEELSLKDMMAGVALKTVGGSTALRRLQNASARKLLGGPS